MSIDTQVSKTSPAIKQIIAATIGADWPGKRVTVREVSPSWTHTEYIDDKTLAWYVPLSTLGIRHVRIWQPVRPSYGGPPVVHPAPQANEALVHVFRLRGPQSMEIVVAEDAIDRQAVSVAADALLAGGKKASAAAAEAAKLCGATGGLCLAIAEAHAKSFKKGEVAGDLTATLVSTPQTPSAKRAKKSAAQLEREIKAALAHRR